MSATIDSPLRILLIEDNPNDARLIRSRLENSESAFLPADLALEHVESLGAAVDRIEQQPIDLVLLDLGLPESSGAETYQRASERFPSVPVVVLTGLQDEATAVELLQKGAQDYINKNSLSRKQLVKSVRYAVERQERERKLRTTTEQLEVLNRILRHDIQNDLQVLRLWTEAMVGEVGPEHEEIVERMYQTTGHIQELTENSREYIEAITGTDELETEPTRLDHTLSDELQKASSRYEDADFIIDESLPAVTVSAHRMLSSVFRNLLNNAVQHNQGQATVTVAVEQTDDLVRTTVTDDGPGVPDDQKDEIFGKGEQGLDSDGTGIGLYLAYTLVTEFGGDVWVEDRQDGESGAVFVVELPPAEESAGE